MTLAQAVLELFCSIASNISLLLEKIERGDNSVMDLKKNTKSWSGHQHLRHNMWNKYHDPGLSGAWDILFTNMRKMGKGDNSVMDLENFTKS